MNPPQVYTGSMHNTRCLGLVHWDYPERWYGEGGWRRVQDGEHVYTLVTFKCGSPRTILFVDSIDSLYVGYMIKKP